MEKQYFNLMQFFEGYVRNYRRMNLSNLHNRSMFTKREIEYFASLGEVLGFDAFVEDSKYDKSLGRSRPMDVAWWKWDSRLDEENYIYLALHLERENVWKKDVETIEKLFSDTEEGFIPHNVIGIQAIESEDRIDLLNTFVLEKNAVQKSHALMIYRYYEPELEIERVAAYYFTPEGLADSRKAVFTQDQTGCWFMCFDEEYVPFKESELATK